MPDILKYHSVIIPALINNIGTLEPELTQKVIFCIDMFLENLEDEVN